MPGRARNLGLPYWITLPNSGSYYSSPMVVDVAHTLDVVAQAVAAAQPVAEP